MATTREVLMQMKSEGWTERAEVIREAVDITGTTRDRVAKLYKEIFGPEQITLPRGRKKDHIRGSDNVPRGITRGEAQASFDIPFKISSALDGFINLMQEGMLYEDSEVRRACKISKLEEGYWEEITQEHGYAQHTGLTESNKRLWGTLEDIDWALDNITGFRKES